jgi:hypothetical protein
MNKNEVVFQLGYLKNAILLMFLIQNLILYYDVTIFRLCVHMCTQKRRRYYERRHICPDDHKRNRLANN